MHKVFYASGFLYHSPTQQILLHQQRQAKNTSTFWQMFGEVRYKEEPIEAVFQEILYTFLKVKIPLKDIYLVYDYFHSTLHKTHYVFFAKVTEMPRLRLLQKDTISWFTFKQTLKLSVPEQTKQDLVVAQRVINAIDREVALSIATQQP